MDPIKAEYESKCAACGSEIHVGDEIVTLDGEWVHIDCALEDE